MAAGTGTARWRSRATALGVVAALVVAVVAVVSVADDGVVVETITVTAPTSVDDDTPITLDAALYLPPTDEPRPAVVLGHGFGSDRTAVDAYARRLAADGRVVLTWSARGFGDSQGRIGVADPDADAYDVRALVDVLAERPEVQQDGPGDPRVAITGGSYGGGLALLGATLEPRLDAVAAVATWHDLADALSPDRAGDGGPGVLSEQWLSVLFAGAAASGGSLTDLLGGGEQPAPDAAPPTTTPADDAGATEQPGLLDLLGAACGPFDPDLCLAYATAATTGTLDEAGAELLRARSVTGRAGSISAPTLLVQGQQDTLFGLDQSLATARELAAAGTPWALRWVPGGHGEVGSGDPGQAVTEEVGAWLDRWLPVDAAAPTPVGDEPPPVTWVDNASGVAREAASLDLGDTAPWVLTADGGLSPADTATAPGVRTVVRPPGALPASISTLPGLGGLGDLLPALDLPVQSTSWTSDPLDEDLSLLGVPRLTLDVDATGDDEALVFVKLQEVSPGGRATLLMAAANPTRIGDLPATATIDLAPLAHRLTAGNRLRLVVATTDQAFAVPRAPVAITLDATAAGAGLVLPVVPPDAVAVTPPLVRVMTPVVVVLLGGLAAAWWTRRRETARATEPADEDAPPVRITGLRKTYADGKVAVDGIDLEVGRGQVLGLLGPNGAGKTTTMRMLLGLIHPTAGSVELFGRRVTPGHPVLRRVGVLVEGPGFAPMLTGRQNLWSWWDAGGRPRSEADMDRALEVADLGTAIDRPTRAYSHGMRQRLAIAQALLGDPELLVLDEPTDGLDPEQIRAMRRLLARLGEEGITVLVSSHLLAEVEQMCTHVAVVNAGRVVAIGPVPELLGTDRSVLVRTDDRTRAGAVLGELLGDDRVALEGDGHTVDLDGADAAVGDVVAALVAADLRVEAVTPRGRLEDTFLALTGGSA
jgi:ABC-2 type transport system ATP-binding protein